MAYEIKLFVHGVPSGQRSWGVENESQTYIDNFYNGQKIDISTQMLAEVRHEKNETYCYYTYLRTQNFLDKSARAGGYFALTIRMNHCYSDLGNLYNLLDATYNKNIVGEIVENLEGVTRYRIEDFYQVDKLLKTLDKEINNYLMQFSSNSDFIPLTGFAVNSDGSAVRVNLLECFPQKIVPLIKSKGKISVSPWHPTTREQQIISQKNSTIEDIRNSSQQKITLIENNAKQKIASIKEENEQSIQAIKDQYKEADTKIENLKKELENKQKDFEQLKTAKKEVHKRLLEVQTELQTLQSKYKKSEDCEPKENQPVENEYASKGTEIEELKKELEKYKEELEKYKEELRKSNREKKELEKRFLDLWNKLSNGEHRNQQNGNLQGEKGSCRGGCSEDEKNLLKHIGKILIIVLLVGVSFFCWKEEKTAKEQVTCLKRERDGLHKKIDSLNKEIGEKDETIVKLKNDNIGANNRNKK